MAAPDRPTSTDPRFLLGNDVVDLSHPRCRATPVDGRLVRRVLAAEERRRLRRATDPFRTLWRMWAAKEAAYKVISKRLGTPPPFRHDAFVVAPGRVSWEGVEVRFREVETSDPDALHVVAWDLAGTPEIEAETVACPPGPPPVDRLSARERDAVHSPASGWVRLEARACAARLLDRAEPDVEIVCGEGPPGRTAPRLLVGGRPAAWDVSLSHHGRWLAWAVGRRAPDAGAGPGLRDGN